MFPSNENEWSNLFNNLPIEKRKEIIVYSIHDEVLMLERQKIDAKQKCDNEINDINKKISIIKRMRDKVWNEICQGETNAI